MIKQKDKLSFNLKDPLKVKKKFARKPKVAILREQGVNGHKEMAHSFHIFRDLHFLHTFAPVRSQKFQQFAKCSLLKDFQQIVCKLLQKKIFDRNLSTNFAY